MNIRSTVQYGSVVRSVGASKATGLKRGGLMLHNNICLIYGSYRSQDWRFIENRRLHMGTGIELVESERKLRQPVCHILPRLLLGFASAIKL